jgi:meso-butanediol dehydrogenase / (S,S)-butanediol dehydrogenase / diacetyl reductase
MELWSKPRTALVTGASRGIGRAIALGLAREGAAVALVARTRGDLEAVAGEIEGHGGRAAVVVADVARPDDITRSIDEAVARLGPIDILVNNAGTNDLGRFEEIAPDAWWQQVEVHLRTPYLFCRGVLPSMVERKWGRIINVSSVSGKKGVMFSSAYCAGKAGLLGLTRALAVEYAARHVTVNAVCPGWVQTDLTDRVYGQRAAMLGRTMEQMTQAALTAIPQKVVMTPDEVVPAVLFLASDGSIRTTGEALNASAGMIMT